MAVRQRAPLATSSDDSMRLLTAAIAVWLFISAFVWPHTMAQRTNTWICGVLAFVFALAAMREPQTRFLNTILSVWLFISAWALPRTSVGTVWNNVIVAIAIFALSLAPSMTSAGSPGALGRSPASRAT